MNKPKIERLEFSADSNGNGLDLSVRQGLKYAAPKSEFVIGLFNDHFEATRYLTLDDLRTIRDWVNEAIHITMMANLDRLEAEGKALDAKLGKIHETHNASRD